jgi:type I restriction enzyme S subunit
MARQKKIEAGVLPADINMASKEDEPSALALDPERLPRGWASAFGGDLFALIRGVTYKKDDATKIPGPGKVAVLRAGNIQNGRLDRDDLVFVPPRYVSIIQRLRAGDLIIAMSSGSKSVVGKVGVVEEDDNETSFGAFCGLMRPVMPELARWLYWLFQTPTYRRYISEKSAGVNINNLRPAHLLELRIVLPPLAEQLRIVGRLESLNKKIQRARATLESIPQLLDKTRLSILVAAFCGDLTEDWRAAHLNQSSATGLLREMRKARREWWEQSEMKKFKLKGKVPKDDQWKARYVEPLEPVSSGFEPENLPKTWAVTNWELLSNWVTYGFTRPMPHVKTGPAIVTAKNVAKGKIDFTNTHRTTKTAFEKLSAKDLPKPGDILITKDGSIGRAAIVPEGVQFCINQSVAVVFLRSCPIDRRFLLWAIEAPFTQRPIQEVARGMAIQHLSITDFAQLTVPIPPLEEQREIIRRVKSAFARLDVVPAVYAEGVAQLDRLDRALLAKAFHGELVPQSARDEPAGTLLARIRAAREVEPIKAKLNVSYQKPRMEELSTESVREAIRQLPDDRFTFDDLHNLLPGDYESLKEIVFFLLFETKPSLKQVFDRKVKAMRLQRVNR